MTRSRDLADLADGDFAGTWTVDGLDVSGTGLVTGVLTTTAQVVQNGGFDSNDASTVIAADGAADNQFALQIQNLESTNDRSYGLYIRAGTTVTDSPLHIYDYTGSTQLFRVTGTGQTLFTDGSESLPSITNIGDTNTGIFFPAADTIAFSEGGSEAMRITSDGNVGIGTTSPGFPLSVEVDNSTWVSRIYNTGSDADASALLVRTDATAAHDALAFGVYADSGYKMVVRSTGNVGIGATSPSAKMHIASADSGANVSSGADELFLEGSGDSGLTIGSGSSSVGRISFADSGTNRIGALDYSHSDNSMRFSTGNGSERMRIDSNGRVGITAAPEFSSTFSALELGTISLITPSTTNGRLVTNLYYDGAYKRKHTGGSLQYEQDGAAGHLWYYDSSASADVGFTQTEMLRLDTSGNLDLHLGNFVVGASGKGIDFSAGAGGNSTSNLLDEYEEGTFTIGLKDGSGSAMGVNNSTGRYTKIGRVVTVEAEVTRNDTQSLTSNLTLTGLPFTSLNANSISSAMGLGKFWIDEGGPSTNNGDTVAIPTINANSTEVLGVRTTSSGAETSERYAQTDELTNGRFVYLSIVYVAA